MKYRTLQEYKDDVFDNLSDEKKLQVMYSMSKQLCAISEYINNQIDKKRKHPYSSGWQILVRIKKELGEKE